MKLDDYVRALTAGLAALEPARRALSESAGVSLTPRTPGTVSLAGKGSRGELLAFGEWLRTLPAGAPLDVRSWSYETLHSPRFVFAPADFAALMDAQTARDAVWERLLALVSESAAMNGEPEVNRGNLRETLLEADDGWWGLMAEQLLQEAQIECAVEGIEFAVPPELEPLFGTAEPPYEDGPLLVYLYPLGSVTVGQLVRLAEAQGRAAGLGKALAAEIAEGFSDFEGQDVADGLAWLRSRTEREAEETALSALVCRAICRLCEEARVNPVIPPELGALFGPDARDQRRAQLRGQVSGLLPAMTAKPWSCYVWQAAGLAETTDETTARARFAEALTAIEAFARTQQSPFAEAFRLASFCLGLEPGAWDQVFAADLRRRLTEAGFSETALEVFDANAGPVAELARLDWPRDRLGAVLALAVADVFGGMGSWNDQDFRDGYDEYARVSGALSEALRGLWLALLAPWGPHGLS